MKKTEREARSNFNEILPFLPTWKVGNSSNVVGTNCTPSRALKNTARKNEDLNLKP